ncbi:hypothetical protein OG203_38595 [Nocardia sp. NBC_01499]|uniref:hypothetical protein n=1 Tax=Nocardia sp. NBC_01499 TaxID=2903597 RepID=UPI00386D8B1A
MLRRAGVIASATALAAVACAGVAGAAPTTTTAPPPTTTIDITGAKVTGDGVDVSVTYNCEATDKTVTLLVFVRSTAEGSEQTVGAKTKATCNAQSQTVSVTATKIAESEPFTPAVGDTVRVFSSLVSGDKPQSLEGGTALKRLAVK